MISEAHSQAARENITKANEIRIARRVAIVCENCGATKMVPPSVAARGQRFCGWECRRSFMRGPNGANAGGGEKIRGDKHPNWKGGDATSRMGRHHEAEVGRWRRRVFHRDGYACQRCGDDRGNNLRAHHVKPWATNPDIRFDVANGLTLCKDCHDWVHSPANVDGTFLG